MALQPSLIGFREFCVGFSVVIFLFVADYF